MHPRPKYMIAFRFGTVLGGWTHLEKSASSQLFQQLSKVRLYMLGRNYKLHCKIEFFLKFKRYMEL